MVIHVARPATPAQGTPFIGPVVCAIRGPSRSGKTTMCQLLVQDLNSAGLRVAWVKRTHHLIDQPGKASDRIWAMQPAATLLLSEDRLALTTPPVAEDPASLLSRLPHDTDVVLFETHTPIAYPAIVSDQLEPAPGEVVLRRWSSGEEAAVVPGALSAIRRLLPADRELDHAMRSALRLHGGHGCAGLVLGTRLALTGAAALGVPVPDSQKRLIVRSETDRCAVDGIQAVTGCRPGKRTLQLLDYGKLAATFFDSNTARAVRVAVRGDLRSRVGVTGPERHLAQRTAYATWPTVELFSIEETGFRIDQFDLPGPPRARVSCANCGEEVSDGRHVETEVGPCCRPCAADSHLTTERVGR